MTKGRSKSKVCTVCKRRKILDQFNRNAARADGRQSRCRPCDRKYARALHRRLGPEVTNARNRRNRDKVRAAVYEYLLGHPCVDCGEADPVVLEFDHVDMASKVSSISAVMTRGWSLRRVMLEVSKCVVRCVKCHRRRTAKQLGWWIVSQANQVKAPQ